MPADDSWLGHQKIDPARGKAHPPGPEQSRGRRDLTELFTMNILHDPRRLELLQKGADKHGDAWCGNILIDPARGKKPYRPLSNGEQGKYAKAFDDRGTRGRRQLHTPGDADPAKEALLTWKPEMRVGQFVKNGGLAQENRVRGHTLRATAGR
eukprot:XP_001698977.1 predicted protein [Chlamydomonas reinhardtii]